MPLFEVETTSHIMIAWAESEKEARAFAATHYPIEEIIRVSHRPRDAWVISKTSLGIKTGGDPCAIARDCLSKAQGDKVHAVRLYMHTTGSDLEGAQGHRVEHGHGLVIRGYFRGGVSCLGSSR